MSSITEQGDIAASKESNDRIVPTEDWNGPDDPRNPWNWPQWKKIYHSAVPIAIGFLCPFGSSVYTPSRQDVERVYSVSAEVALLPFSLYLLGLSLGPIIAGPTSERFGRRAVYLSCLPLFALFTLGAGFSNDATSLIVLRFFAGLFSSPGLSIGTGTLADVWHPKTRTVPMTTYITMVQSGAAFGPLVGGFVAESVGWRWSQWTILFLLAGVITAAIWMSETYKAVILRRSSSLRPDRKKVNHEVKTTFKISSVQKVLSQVVGRPLHMLTTELVVALFDLYVAIDFGILNLFYAAFPAVFQQAYGFNLGAVGLTFFSQVVGNILGWIILVSFSKIYYEPTAAQMQGKPSPEMRLYTAMLGAGMLPISLFWFAWTARPDIHWISPVAAETLFSCGNLLIFSCASLYFTDTYGAKYGASAWSSNTFSRYLLSASFPLFADQMYVFFVNTTLIFKLTLMTLGMLVLALDGLLVYLDS